MKKILFLMAGIVVCLATQSSQAQNTSTTASPVGGAINYQYPFAAPSLATTKLTPSISVMSWFQNLNPLYRNTSPLGTAQVYPGDANLPGMSYLQSFGYRVAQPAQ